MSSTKRTPSLDGLTPDELRQLSAQIALRLAKTDVSVDDGQLHNALVRTLKARGMSAPPLSVLRGQAFDAARDALNEMLTAGGVTQRTRRQKAYFYLVELSAKQLQAASVPVSPTTLIQRARAISIDVERQFPGYRDAGLLKLLFT